MTSSTTTEATFGPFRKFFWPIHRHEFARVLPMLGILFLTCLIFGILRNMKDTLVITAQGGGAEVLPYIKVWGILPMALFSTWLYMRLMSRWSRERVFFWIIAGFISFFLIFTLVLYPNTAHLHPHALANYLETLLPRGLHGLIAMFRNWTFTAFYIMAELWGSVTLSVMFWSFTNEITQVSEAKRFYGVFALFSNSAAAAAGLTGILLAQPEYNPLLPFGSDGWEQTQILFISVVTLAGIAILCLYRRVFSLRKQLHSLQGVKKEKQPRLALLDSFRYLFKNPYLANIAILILSYNLVINLVEVIWKDQVRILYPDRVSYNTYMANLTLAIGVISFCASCPISWLLQRCGWTFTALLTPVVMGLTSLCFFATLFMDGWIERLGFSIMGMQPLLMTVFFGGAQHSLSKAAKYSVFDASREMAFIPLPAEVKAQGKAAIDGVGSRLAKSGSSLLHQSLLVLCGSLSASAPYIAGVVVLVLGAWVMATRSLGKQFNSTQGDSHKHAKLEPELDESEAEAAAAI